MSQTDNVPARKELPPERTWNAASVFASRQAWQQAAAEVEPALEGIKRHKGSMGESPAALLDALRARDELLQQADKVIFYAGMSYFCDTTDSEAAAMHNRATALEAKTEAAVSFYEPEILGIGKETLLEWLEGNKELADYRHYLLDLMRRAEHVRSDEVEELLGQVTAPFQGVAGTANALVNADFVFDPAVDEGGHSREVTPGTLRRLLQSSDRTLRASAWRSYMETYAGHQNALANNLLTSVQQNVFITRARRFDGTLEAALFEDDIPTDVFHNLLQVCDRRAETWNRYFEVRRRALEVDRLEPYDIWAPLAEQRPEVSYEQAVEWICAGLEPMGEEYVEIVRKGCLQDRWVDVYPNRGKRSGAFSSGVKGTHPFIMMSFTDTLGDMSTLAHELGHSMHSYHSWRNQPRTHSDYSLFAAEVASNFHQALVRAHLFETFDDPALQLDLLEEAFSNFHRYLLLMPTLARFELEVHERLERGEGLSVDDLVDRCTELFTAAYGEPLLVEQGNMGLRWAHFPHLYRDYYVFQYSTGISAAHALADRILNDEPGAVDDYLNFLRAGGSMHPIEALQIAGVDMREPAPIEAAFDTLTGMIDRLEQLLG